MRGAHKGQVNTVHAICKIAFAQKNCRVLKFSLSTRRNIDTRNYPEQNVRVTSTNDMREKENGEALGGK